MSFIRKIITKLDNLLSSDITKEWDEQIRLDNALADSEIAFANYVSLVKFYNKRVYDKRSFQIFGFLKDPEFKKSPLDINYRIENSPIDYQHTVADLFLKVDKYPDFYRDFTKREIWYYFLLKNKHLKRLKLENKDIILNAIFEFRKSSLGLEEKNKINKGLEEVRDLVSKKRK